MAASEALNTRNVNLHWLLSFTRVFLFPLLLESCSRMIYLARGRTPWRKGASGGTVASEA
jgi:hypothetical protein